MASLTNIDGITIATLLFFGGTNFQNWGKFLFLLGNGKKPLNSNTDVIASAPSYLMWNPRRPVCDVETRYAKKASWNRKVASSSLSLYVPLNFCTAEVSHDKYLSLAQKSFVVSLHFCISRLLNSRLLWWLSYWLFFLFLPFLLVLSNIAKSESVTVSLHSTLLSSNSRPPSLPSFLGTENLLMLHRYLNFLNVLALLFSSVRFLCLRFVFKFFKFHFSLSQTFVFLN